MRRKRDNRVEGNYERIEIEERARIERKKDG